MKKLMIVAIAMVMLLGISEKAQADPWTNWAFRRSSCVRSSGSMRYGGRYLGRSPWTDWAFGRRSYGGYGLGSIFGNYGGYGRYGTYGGYGYGRDKTLGRVLGYGELALGTIEVLGQDSRSNRLVDHEILMDNQMMDIARKEQRIKVQTRIPQIQKETILVITDPVIYRMPNMKEEEQGFKDQQIRARNGTVLVRVGPKIVLQMKKPKEVQPKAQMQENKELQQKVKALEIQLKELQQKLEAKK